jgi:hypothetical protein
VNFGPSFIRTSDTCFAMPGVNWDLFCDLGVCIHCLDKFYPRSPLNVWPLDGEVEPFSLFHLSASVVKIICTGN